MLFDKILYLSCFRFSWEYLFLVKKHGSERKKFKCVKSWYILQLNVAERIEFCIYLRTLHDRNFRSVTVTKLQTIVVVVCRQNCTAVNFPQDLIVGLRKPFMVVISLWQQPICNHCRKVLSFAIWSKLKLDTGRKKIAINFNNFGQKERLSIRGQREVFFRSRDKNENFSYSISHIVTRWEFLALNLRHRDEIEIHYLQSRTSRREGELRIRQFSRDLVFATCNLTDIFQRKRLSNFDHWEI